MVRKVISMLKRRFLKLLCILAIGLAFSGCSSTAEVGPITEYQNKPVEEVESELKNQGYSNISTEEQENRSGSEYANTVIKVTLNGVSISDSPIKAGFSEPLVIYYRGIYSGIIKSPENADFYSGASLIDVKSQFIALGFKEVELEPIPNDQGSSFN